MLDAGTFSIFYAYKQNCFETPRFINRSLFLCFQLWIHRLLKFKIIHSMFLIEETKKLTKKKCTKKSYKHTVQKTQSYVENAEKLWGSNKGKSKNREKISSDSCGQPTFREGPLLCECPLRCGAIQVSSGVENGRWVL